jgi:hypothetical protein
VLKNVSPTQGFRATLIVGPDGTGNLTHATSVAGIGASCSAIYYNYDDLLLTINKGSVDSLMKL